MYQRKIMDYVPEPKPVSSDYTVACHYYPGWKLGGTDIHSGFCDLVDYPERTPLLGYYDEANPEVTDWEIKWAVEHGVNCYIYCWYRYKNNVGKPLTRKALRLGHALHEGLFQARYQRFIKFAIMFECNSSRWGIVEDEDDFINHVVPFWIEQYFSKDNYLKYKDVPVVYIYSPNDFIQAFGSEEATQHALERCNQEMQKHGFAGIHFSCLSSGNDAACRASLLKSGEDDLSEVARLQQCGFHSAFQYSWPMYAAYLTPEQLEDYRKTLHVPAELILETQWNRIKSRIGQYPDYFMYTNSVMRDSHPWFKIFGLKEIPKDESGILWWVLSPEDWRKLLEGTKRLIDKLPEGSIGRSIIVLDNWNEWSEGHYIFPHTGHGFQYLQAVREAFTKRDNLPDYRTPQILDLGPYDSEWIEEIKATGIDL